MVSLNFWMDYYISAPTIVRELMKSVGSYVGLLLLFVRKEMV
jgi:hypothetical protein